MARVMDDLARRQLRVGTTGSFDLERADTELQRLAEAGSLVALTKGIYALVPEHHRSPDTAWRPTIEGAALGTAASLYDPSSVALVGPSAARALRCYPRPLGRAWVAVPTQRRPRTTTVGEIRFVTRDIAPLDLVRIDTDLGPGLATSPEQTALDLCRDRPRWDITEDPRDEMLTRLADRIDWHLIEQVADQSRSRRTLRRLRDRLGVARP